jgi:ABC-type polysaccharide/polyol phosphate export permease
MVQGPSFSVKSPSARAADLVVALTARELRMRYQGTVFGYLWWIARPLALGLVLYFAMGRVVKLDIDNYGAFLMCGLFPWFWFQSTVNDSAGVFVGNAGLVKKVVFPRMVLPLSSILYNTVQFLLTLPVITLFIYTSGNTPHLSWVLGLPALFVVELLLLVGIGVLVSSLYVFFRDVGPILDVGLTLGFYMSPVIYPIDRVPEKFKPILMVNPLAPLLEAWRNLLISGDLPGLALWPTILFAGVALAVGFGVFRRIEKYFADAI